MVNRVLLATLVFSMALPAAARAEGPPGPPSRKDRTPQAEKQLPGGGPPMDLERMQEDMSKVQKEMEKLQKEQLDLLKEQSPDAYESQKKMRDRQVQISQVLAAYNQKTITAEDAERKLTPLIRQEFQEQQGGLDQQIKLLEKKLASLKEARANQSAQVKKRVDQMLGRGGPPSAEELPVAF